MRPPAPRRSPEIVGTALSQPLAPGRVARPCPGAFVMPCSVCGRCIALDFMAWLPGAGIRRVACDRCAPIVWAGQQ